MMSSTEHNGLRRPPSHARSDSAKFDQRKQVVSTQFNIAGDAVINSRQSSQKSSRMPQTRAEIIQSIEREFACDLRALDRCYVIPDLQDFNPPDEMNSASLIVSRQPAFQVFNEFVARPSLTEIGQRCLFVLGDAGMGKTSLLLMLAFRHLDATRENGWDCVLMKLGPDTLERIAVVPNPARTILLLDSLDEDPAAHAHPQGAEGRLLELLPRLVQFQRIVLTCRTQFFPEISRRFTTLAGHFVVGSYECPLKYLSLFNDAQVEQYLGKRYEPGLAARLLRAWLPWTGDSPKLTEARQAAKSMESLRLRPLLLSRIDDFVSRDGRPCVDFRNRYAVYHRLVDQWLMRDAQKPLGMSSQESWRATTLLALHLARQGTRMIDRSALAQVEGLNQIPQFKIESRSLLNRNKDYQFQFAHTTMQEFLLAHAILDDTSGFDVAGLQLSRQACRFLIDGQRFLGKQTVSLRGAKAGFADAAIEFVRLTFGLELVPIPAGEFLMGSPPDEKGRFDSETQHQVRLTVPFWIGRYPVTQAEYQAVMGTNPSEFKGERRPVENVDWHEAMAFCQQLTERARQAGWLPDDFAFRLPTEAEWEYACRAGTTTAFNDGSDCTKPEGKDPALDRLGWFDKNSGRETHPVGEKQPNAWGLYDMHGNVWEWCWDGKRKYTTEPQLDPVGPLEGARRVVRGGSYWYNARRCRSAYRSAIEPGYRYGNQGFRLAAGQEFEGGAKASGASGRSRGAEGRSPAERPESGAG
jgi:formylglycine-generating enzyme required for sulfatase activity